MRLFKGNSGQVALEYIVTFGFVLFALVISLRLIGGVDVFKPGNEQQFYDTDLKYMTIAIDYYNIGDANTKLKIRNNFYNDLAVNYIRFSVNDSLQCNSGNSALPRALAPGETYVLDCYGLNSSSFPPGKFKLYADINYRDLTTNAFYITKNYNVS